MGFRGRGRGRGAGAGRPQGVMDIAMDSTQYSEPELYPSSHIVSPFREWNPAELAVALKQLEMRKIMQKSSYYLVKRDEKKGLSGYSEKYRSKDVRKGVREGIEDIGANKAFFPEELVKIKKTKKVVVDEPGMDMKILAQLEQEEATGLAANEDEESDQEEGEEDGLEEDFEEDNDYGVDYYDDDMDALGSDGGGGDY